MLESERLLLNIKATHQQIINIGKMALDPKEKAKILHRLDSEKVGYEAALIIAKMKEASGQVANRPTTH